MPQVRPHSSGQVANVRKGHGDGFLLEGFPAKLALEMQLQSPECQHKASINKKSVAFNDLSSLILEYTIIKGANRSPATCRLPFSAPTEDQTKPAQGSTQPETKAAVAIHRGHLPTRRMQRLLRHSRARLQMKAAGTKPNPSEHLTRQNVAPARSSLALICHGQGPATLS